MVINIEERRPDDVVVAVFKQLYWQAFDAGILRIIFFGHFVLVVGI